MGERATILLLSQLNPQCGNNSTANRIQQHFLHTPFKCLSLDSRRLKSTEEFSEFLITHDVQVVIGIHAYHSGKWLKDSPVPYCVILGGTDINEAPQEPDKMAVMTEAVLRSRCAVAFSAQMKAQAEMLWPELKVNESVQVIPQAVETFNTSPPSGTIKKVYNIPEETRLVTMVGGIRPVKDPLFLLSHFNEWQNLRRKKVLFIIIGPILHKEYGESFKKTIQSYPGVLYLGGLSIQDTHNLIGESFALVNSSVSEGQATAILEAMALGTPVVVRDIQANRAVVRHGETGLLYSTPEDFLQQLEQLHSERDLSKHLIQNAQSYVHDIHNCHKEKSTYVDIVHELYRFPCHDGLVDESKSRQHFCDISCKSPFKNQGKTNGAFAKPLTDYNQNQNHEVDNGRCSANNHGCY